MKLSILSLALLCGCAHYSTHQTDTSYGTNGPTREIKTEVSVYTFFDSKSEVVKSRVTQTDKTQSSSVGALNQESSGTNVIGLVEAISAGATKGALQYVAPK